MWNEETEKSKITVANYMCRMGKCLQETDHMRPCTSDINWMPIFFADTCILAHGLGIKYVWIDAICIRQDDDEEWNREAPRMARYYQNAWITVVAANKIVANGLLNIRRTEPVPRMTRLPCMDRNEEQKGYFYLQLARPDVLQEEFSVGVGKSELLQRGWVFQEWKLSRRIIAFSDSGFFLYCHTSGSMSPMGDHLEGAGVRLGQNSQSNGHITQRRNFSPSKEWKDIVTEYSGLGLTCLVKDRLIALAGVASEFGRIMKALNDTSSIPGPSLSDDVSARQYICGLWLTNIHQGLLWEQATRGTRERLPGIPTWSWTSMSSPVIDKNNKRVLIGMSVRWPKIDSLLSEKQRVYAIRKATTIPVDDQNWLPQFSKRPFQGDVPDNEYGNENRFIVLTFHSSLILVQIRTPLSEQDADLANEMTSTNGTPHYEAPYHPWTMSLWRGICLPTDPNRATGWASLKHPEFQSEGHPEIQCDEKTVSSCGSIYALFLERWDGKPDDSLISGVIYTVLLVRRVSIPGFNESFVRVGVGRLFGEEVNRRHLSTAKTTISLV